MSASDKPSDTSPKESQKELLRPLHNLIARWRAGGMTFRDIAQQLKLSAKVDVTHSAVYRYCRDNDLKPDPEPKPPSNPTSSPAEAGRRRRRSGYRPTAVELVSQACESSAGDALDGKPTGAPQSTDAEPARASADPDRADEPASIPLAVVPAQIPSQHTGAASTTHPAQLKSANRSQEVDVRRTCAPEGVASEQAAEQPFRAAQTDSGGVGTRATAPAPVAPEAEEAGPPAPMIAGPPQYQLEESLRQYLLAELPHLNALDMHSRAYHRKLDQMTRVVFLVSRRTCDQHRSAADQVLAVIRAWKKSNPPRGIIGDWLTRWRKVAGTEPTAATHAQAPEPAQGSVSSVPHSDPQTTSATAPTLPDSSDPVQQQQQNSFAPLPVGPFWPPELPVLAFNGGDDVWTLQDATEGVLVMGQIGSGKTSGSGQALAEAFLARGFGGIVLSAKQDEPARWEHYAARTGRSEQLCLVGPGSPWRFNFLDYQSRLPEDQGGSVDNVVELFCAAMRGFSKDHPDSQNDRFWVDATRQLITSLIRLLRLGKQPLNLQIMRQVLDQAPLSLKAVRTKHWMGTETFGPLIQTATEIRERDPRLRPVMDELLRYWLGDFPKLNSRTRSIIIVSFSAMASSFFDPDIWELFCTSTTLTPRAAMDGAVIVINLPLKRWRTVGKMGQAIWKHFFQMAVEKRDDKDDVSRRPVFLWADEAQFFWSDYDAEFQATARSSRCCTVYLTQNVPNFQAEIGGHMAREKMDGFFGNLNTKIFHANNDATTNKWAADHIGQTKLYRTTIQTGESHTRGGSGTSLSRNEVVDYQVLARQFMGLRNGTKRNNYEVDAFVVKGGGRFSSGSHHFQTYFKQEQQS